MINRDKLASNEEIMQFGFRDLASPAPTDEEQKKLHHDNQQIIVDLKKAEQLIELASDKLARIGISLFTQREKKYADGAIEHYPGLIEKDIYNDLTNKNKIANITVSITDQKIYPKSPSLHINVVFSSLELAAELRNLFKSDKLDMVDSGTHACGFANYPSTVLAFKSLIERQLISQSNADLLLSEIKLFLEGRNVLPKPTASCGVA